jgi:uncharacterized protein YabE (DUF348 family)
MVSGVTAFVSFNRSIQLTVDGKTSKIHTFASSVAGVLARQGITLSEHDSVVPDPERSVPDGARIAVRFGRPVDLELDGSANRVWVTATTVHEALDQLGLGDENMVVSASRSAPIGRAGLALRVLTPREVTVVADGRARHLNTAAATVRQLLLEAGIALDPKDEVNPQLDSTPVGGSSIRVVRVLAKQLTIKVELPFNVRKIKDPTMFPWDRKVVTPGVKGVKEVTLELVSRDGRVASRNTVVERVISAPVTEVVRVGTKPTRYAATGAEHMNWGSLARCESGGDPHAVNSSGAYHGLYQFSPGTWQTVGGHGKPSKASAEEQTYRAELLYKRAGAGQWPVCGRHLHDH